MGESREKWDIAHLLSERLNVDKNTANNIIQMIEVQECTIPFISRYRKEVTHGMDPNTLRMFLDTLKELRDVQKKATTAIRQVQKQEPLDHAVVESLNAAETVEEINVLLAPYKVDKKTLACRARTLGLDNAAKAILNNPRQLINLNEWVKKDCEGRANLKEVKTGVKHIICEAIARDKTTLERIKRYLKPTCLTLEAKMSASKKKAMDAEKEKGGHSTSQNTSKFECYHHFQHNVSALRSYQVLAINRGEALKELTVKIHISERAENNFIDWCNYKWAEEHKYEDMKTLLKECVTEAYTRLLKPQVLRKTRSELTKTAQMDSVHVFGRNLKKLLLTSPVRGKIILGIDPGYKNGCKCAVVSSNGMEILAVDVFYLHHANPAVSKLLQLLNKFNIQLIGIGNGTACRETEELVSRFIYVSCKKDLKYCIVNESGASIYSVTEEAKQEMPDLDPNLRSAVSIARRLQDPLVELVKIDAKHLGIGMYQHDIPDILMKATLQSVVEDCVTFVGVDLNVAGASLLRHVAGLKKTQVDKILKWREKNGPFINRDQLLEVPGVGKKTFEQCAGFMRIVQKANTPSECQKKSVKTEHVKTEPTDKRKRKITATSKNSKKQKLHHEVNPLDQTWIHPESYKTTEQFLKKINLSSSEVGKDYFISNIKQAVRKKTISQFANELEVGEPTLQLIIDGLSAPCGYRDIRNVTSHFYKTGISCITDLRCGTTMQGKVSNVVDFGIFVDIGVGTDGLVHSSDMKGKWEELRHVLGPNDLISVAVTNVNKPKKRISLRLVKTDVVETKFM
uniref:S1 RNA-binding domain-containing protein 1-like n=1 Tax=Ciona intestinalis TaxID=7719 RepID=UPI000180C576|nr:S1 RNA-binding domain-containing protein 1-like [Ciona intestinalis]|eukprot:XP_009857620.1 S1 RNA-binding domain-containing protein 1-like [Ciona intestinalis]